MVAVKMTEWQNGGRKNDGMAEWQLSCRKIL
jgi:hypothetical protein